jgi:hypothetical protein
MVFSLPPIADHPSAVQKTGNNPKAEFARQQNFRMQAHLKAKFRLDEVFKSAGPTVCTDAVYWVMEALRTKSLNDLEAVLFDIETDAGPTEIRRAIKAAGLPTPPVKDGSLQRFLGGTFAMVRF